MNQRLEMQRTIRISKPGEPAYAVAHSADGEYTAVTNDHGVTLFNTEGVVRLKHPPQAWPIHLVAAPGDFSYLLVGTRRGAVTRLNLARYYKEESSPVPEKKRAYFSVVDEQVLYFADNDLNTLSLSNDGELLGIGHYGPTLTVTDLAGRTVWEKTTENRYWSVGLDEVGRRFYIASAGVGTNRLVLLDAQSWVSQNGRSLNGRVTRLTVMPQNYGVVIVLNDGYSYWLQAYDSALGDLLWEKEYGEPVTAVAADRTQPLLAIATGYQGEVMLLNGETGEPLTEPLPTQSYVNDIAMSKGFSITAVTEDGVLCLIHYKSASAF